MNELTRMAYLEAMGVDSYISRAQLPGAAMTRRLVLVPHGAKTAGIAATTGTAAAPAPQQERPAEKIQSALPMPALDAARPRPKRPEPESDSEPAVQTASQSSPLARFSLTAIVAGNWLWLEDLQGMPLTRDQVQLVQAMAVALQHADASQSAPAAGREDISQFDWPMHTNQQLDLGEEAAHAALASFVRRKQEKQQCRGVVSLGRACGARVEGLDLGCPQVVASYSSAEMLADAALKRQVWSELKALVSVR